MECACLQVCLDMQFSVIKFATSEPPSFFYKVALARETHGKGSCVSRPHGMVHGVGKRVYLFGFEFKKASLF
jgi:hypothetical protein